MTNEQQLKLFKYLINLKTTLQFKKQLPRIQYIEHEINILLETLARGDFPYFEHEVIGLTWMGKGTNPNGLNWSSSDDVNHLANALGRQLNKYLN